MNSSLKNAILMLAPCVILVGVGLLLKNRKPAVLTVSGPFKPYIKAVRIVPPQPSEVHLGYDTKVEVELGAHGGAPAWWQQGFGSYGGSDSGQLVVKAGQTVRKVGTMPNMWSPHLDRDSKKWISTYLLKLVPLGKEQGEIRLRDQVRIFNDRGKQLSPTLWLDSVVRPRGTVVQPPKVSHNPHLTLTRLVLGQGPPVESHVTDSYRLQLWFNKKGSLHSLAQRGVQDYLHVSDANGQEVELNGPTTYSNGVDMNDFGYDGTGELNKLLNTPQDAHDSYMVHEFTMSTLGTMPGGPPLTKPLKHPLWIQGDVHFGDYWPLWLKVPLTDATGKFLLTPRPKPAFRVLSTAVNTPQSTGTTGDTFVRIDLVPIDPKADVSRWKWNGRFSQHVHPARGKDIWTFPLSIGRQEANVEYLPDTKNNKMTIRYELNLSTIPTTAGTLTFMTEISGNDSTYLPVQVVVRAATPTATPTPAPLPISTASP